MSKNSGRQKHHEFHFSGDDMAIDSPEVVDGDDDGVCTVGDDDSDRVGVDSLNSGDSVCKDSEGGVSEDSVEEDFEDPSVEGPDEDSDLEDWLVFFLMATTNICLN